MTDPNNSSFAGSAALLVWGSVPEGHSDLCGLNDWWTNEHLPERISIPGFRRARRYESGRGEDREQHYLTLYEVDSLETLTSRAYMEKLNNPTPGTQMHLPALTSMKRAGCRVLGSYVRPGLRAHAGVMGGRLLMLEMAIPPEEATFSAAREAMLRCFRQTTDSDKDILCCHLLVEDHEATAPGSHSQSYREINLSSATGAGSVRMVLLIEGTQGLEQYGNGLASLFKVEESQEYEIKSRVYRLMCSIGS